MVGFFSSSSSRSGTSVGVAVLLLMLPQGRPLKFSRLFELEFWGYAGVERQRARQKPARPRPSMGRLWQIDGCPQTVAAATPVFGHAGTHRVGAVATDEPTVLIRDHRSEFDSHEAVRAADDQCRVGWRPFHAGIAAARWHPKVNNRKLGKLSKTASKVVPRCRHFGRHADGRQANGRNLD